MDPESSSLEQSLTPTATGIYAEEAEATAKNGGLVSTWQGRVSSLAANTKETFRKKPASHWVLLSLSSAVMLIAFTASSLLSRAYYADGGQSYWIISWSAVVGWPLILIFLIPMYVTQKISPTPVTLRLLLWYVGLGFLSAADNLLFAWAYAYLSASTASLLASTSLIFSALFGFVVVKNKLYASSINAIVIISAATAIIALDMRADRIPGVSSFHYALGFVWDILGSAVHGLIFALSELVFMKILGRRSFHVVLELQTMVSFFAFIFTTIGVAVNDDFAGMKREAAVFKNGEGAYVSIIVWAAITFQLGILAGTAVLFLASTVMAGVLNAIRVPLTSIVAVILFHDPMSGFKILSLILTVWGFGSYIYGHSSKKES